MAIDFTLTPSSRTSASGGVAAYTDTGSTRCDTGDLPL